MFKKITKRIFEYFGYQIISNNIPVDFSKFEKDLIQEVKNYTMTSPERIKSLIDSVYYIDRNNLTGSIVECGVWRGGSMMAAMLTLKSLKKNKLILQKLFIDNNIKGTLIISNEGLNGTISGKSKNISLISKKIKSLFGIINFDSENLSKSKFQPFHKPKIKIKREVVPMGLKIETKNKKTNYVEPSKWNNLITDKNTFILD